MTSTPKPTMIEPAFLSHLRRNHRAEMVLVLVQLEQLCPGWWESLAQLADQIGTDRATLNRSLRHLGKYGLVARHSISNRSGTWIWWVKRHADDRPHPDAEPAWIVRNVPSGRVTRIPISKRNDWAAAHGIPISTFCGFLCGRQELLRGKWKVMGSPFDFDQDPEGDMAAA